MNTAAEIRDVRQGTEKCIAKKSLATSPAKVAETKTWRLSEEALRDLQYENNPSSTSSSSSCNSVFETGATRAVKSLQARTKSAAPSTQKETTDDEREMLRVSNCLLCSWCGQPSEVCPPDTWCEVLEEATGAGELNQFQTATGLRDILSNTERYVDDEGWLSDDSDLAIDTELSARREIKSKQDSSERLPDEQQSQKTETATSQRGSAPVPQNLHGRDADPLLDLMSLSPTFIASLVDEDVPDGFCDDSITSSRFQDAEEFDESRPTTSSSCVTNSSSGHSTIFVSSNCHNGMAASATSLSSIDSAGSTSPLSSTSAKGNFDQVYDRLEHSSDRAPMEVSTSAGTRRRSRSRTNRRTSMLQRPSKRSRIHRSTAL